MRIRFQGLEAEALAPPEPEPLAEPEAEPEPEPLPDPLAEPEPEPLWVSVPLPE